MAAIVLRPKYTGKLQYLVRVFSVASIKAAQGDRRRPEPAPMNEDKAGEPLLPRMLLDGTSIPEAILKDPTLSVSARLLWGILAAYQRNSGECSPLEEALAVDLGVKVRQLQSYLKELENYTRGDPPEAVPLLAVTRVWVEKERKTRNSYTLLWPPFLAVAPKEAGTTRAHLVNGGDAQSVAYRSGEKAPNTDPAPPGIRKQDGGVVPTDVSPSDPQSSARRGEGEAQYTAPDRPPIPTEQGDAAPDSMSPGDAQYAAHWSGGDPQQPAISWEDSDAVPDRMPWGDTQSLAHRPQGDPPDTERPAILGGDAGTVPDVMHPGDAGARVVSTQSRELSPPQTQLLGSVLPRSAGRPVGPGYCMRHSFLGKCSKCGAMAKPIHIRMGGMSGSFCESCCPVCHPGA